MLSLMSMPTGKTKLEPTACFNCDSLFTPKTKNQIFCCKECNKVFNHLKENNRKKEAKYYEPVQYSTPDFCFIDGEAIKHGTFTRNYINSKGESINEQVIQSHYVMLQSDAAKPLFAECLTDRTKPIEALSTVECLEWLCQKEFNGKTLIGYYLNYDFENWLKDVPQDLYLELLQAKEIEWNGFFLWMIPKKIFRIRKGEKGTGKTTEFDRFGLGSKAFTRTIYDYSGYWQRAFLKTVEANKDCCTDDEWNILVEGKESRNVFSIDEWEKIAEYNQTECVVGTKIAIKSFDTIANGFKEAGINVIPRGKDSFSPKCLATKFYKSLKWKEKHPILSLTNEDDIKHFTESLEGLGDEKNILFPFSAAYSGGRIETLILGKINKKIYASDIRSGYPKGLSMMPEWNKEDIRYTTDLKTINNLIDMRIAGMYLVEYKFSDNWAFYPFAFRNKYGNVYYPSMGKSWVSCLELYAMLNTIPDKEIERLSITACCFIAGTEKQGAIDLYGKPPTESGLEWDKAYNARLKMKKVKNSGEYGVKLLLNAGYGGTIQQVGVKDWTDEKSLKVFNDFVGMWITAYCRATVWLSIAPHRKNKDAIIAIQTDGVYSTVPLDIPTDERLGCWEVEEYDWFNNLMAGIYQYSKKGKVSQKQRGWGKSFDFNKADECLRTGKPYSITQDAFITKGFSIHQKNILNGCTLQWIPVNKDFVPSAASKRDCKPKVVLGKKEYLYCKPKPNVAYIMGQEISKPFKLKFSDVNHDDSCKDEKYIFEHIEGNEDYHAGIEE